ncbi:MAG: DUF4124 domain-containing protein [Acidobacteriota bacterium]
MLRLVSITALVLAGACSLARADVFRWVDSEGVVHYSDEWVPGSTVVKTTVRPHSESSPTSSTARAGSRVNEQIDNQDNARAVQQDVAKARDSQCSWAKDRYMKAIASRRVYKEGKDGERQYMSDADADAYREQARKDVQQACGSVPEWKPDQAIPEPQPIPEPKVNPALATSQ